MTMIFSDEAPSWILDRITRLLEERAGTGKLAARIIMMLEDCDERGVNGGHNKDIDKAVSDRIQREDK